MSSPYLPSGAAGLPANRSVIFASGSNVVEVFDESILTENGDSVEAYVVTPRLNRSSLDHLYTLSMLTLFYKSVGATELNVLVSPDGGESWTFNKTVEIESSSDRVSTVSVGVGVTGEDLRVKISLPKDVLVIVSGYRPLLIRRGSVEYR